MVSAQSTPCQRISLMFTSARDLLCLLAGYPATLANAPLTCPASPCISTECLHPKTSLRFIIALTLSLHCSTSAFPTAFPLFLVIIAVQARLSSLWLSQFFCAMLDAFPLFSAHFCPAFLISLSYTKHFPIHCFMFPIVLHAMTHRTGKLGCFPWDVLEGRG